MAILDFENEELVDRIIEFREREDDDGNRCGFMDFNELKKSAEDDEDDYGEDNVLFHKDSIALISEHFDINSSVFAITAVSPTKAIIASGENNDGSASPALPARGWIWMIKRTNKGEINTISLRATTQPAKYLESER